MTSNKDLHFKGQQSNETLICFFRHHWIVLIKEFLYLAIFLLIAIITLSKIGTIKDILIGERELKLLFATGFLIGTIYIHRFFFRLLNHFLNIGIITDLRIIDHQKTLLFKDTMDAIDMYQIQNIECIGEGILPNLLKYGDIKIYLSASSAVRTLTYIPNAKFHFRCITRQKEALQQFRDRPHNGIAPTQEQVHTHIERPTDTYKSLDEYTAPPPKTANDVANLSKSTQPEIPTEQPSDTDKILVIQAPFHQVGPQINEASDHPDQSVSKTSKNF